MTTPDKSLARKLNLNERDALVAAMRDDHGRLRVEAKTDGHTVAFDLAAKGLLAVSEIGTIRQDGSMVHAYEITRRGRRVVRLLPEYSGKPLETLWIKIVPNSTPNADGEWISVDEFDIAALERSKLMTDQFHMLTPHVPDGWHPVQMKRVKPEEVEG